MKNFKKISIALTLGVASLVMNSQSFAQTSFSNQEVLRVGCGVSSVGCFIILAAPVNPANCSGNGTLVSFDGTTPSGKNALATALTIKAAGFNANLTINNSSCNGPNPSLIAITAN